MKRKFLGILVLCMPAGLGGCFVQPLDGHWEGKTDQPETTVHFQIANGVLEGFEYGGPSEWRGVSWRPLPNVTFGRFSSSGSATLVVWGNWFGDPESVEVEGKIGFDGRAEGTLRERTDRGGWSTTWWAERVGDGVGDCEAQPVKAPEMVSVYGPFEMGDPWGEGDDDERPVHTVNLTPYLIGEYEVTNQEVVNVYQWADGQGYFDTVNADTVQAYGEELLDIDDKYSCHISYSTGAFMVEASDGYYRSQHPVTDIRWYGAAVYCNWLSENQGLQPCYDTDTWECDFSKSGFRLPSEAEWERAAAWDPAENRHYRYGSSNDTINCNMVNYTASRFYGSCNPAHEGSPFTSPVGYLLMDSPEGCYDMSGNVWEWCNDWYDPYYYTEATATDPHGSAVGDTRVLRGGCWDSSATDCRAANRFNATPEETHVLYSRTNFSHFGFRVARTRVE